MHCQKARRMISLYIDGELKRDQAQELLEHTNSCPACGSEMEFMVEVLKNLPVQKNLEVSPYFFAKVREKIRQSKETNPIFFPLNLKPAFLGISLFVVIIIFSALAGVFLGETYIAQAKKSEIALDKETKSSLNLDVFEDVPEGSFGYIQNEMLGGA